MEKIEIGVKFVIGKLNPKAINKKRKKVSQVWDRTKITETKKGQTYNIYERIQKFKNDTEFYTILEKHHCTVDEAQDYMMTNLNKIASDMNTLVTYRDAQDLSIKAKELWDNLPLKTRQEFNNDIAEFMSKKGLNYINNLIEKQNPIKESEEVNE